MLAKTLYANYPTRSGTPLSNPEQDAVFRSLSWWIRGDYQKRTLFNAVLLDLAIALLLLDALDAVVKVVLGGGTLLGVLALCKSQEQLACLWAG